MGFLKIYSTFEDSNDIFNITWNQYQKNTHFKILIDLKFFADFGKGKTNINYTKH